MSLHKRGPNLLKKKKKKTFKKKKFRCLHFQFILITFESEKKTFAEAGHSMSNSKMRLKNTC